MSSTSKKNSARERMRAERARQAARKQRTTRITVFSAVGVVIVGAVAGGVAWQTSRSSTNAPLVVPKHTTGTHGTVITYGDPHAKHTLAVYEDFRCPYCGELERQDGATIQKLADQGTYKIEYHMATFLDGNLGGTGSKKALNAAAAALNDGGIATFKKFHDELYKNQPDEKTDGFADTATLLKIAGKVPGLRTAAFDKAVKDDTYKTWVSKVSDAFNTSGVTGTPTVKLDGKSLTVIADNGSAVSPQTFTAEVKQQIG